MRPCIPPPRWQSWAKFAFWLERCLQLDLAHFSTLWPSSRPGYHSREGSSRCSSTISCRRRSVDKRVVFNLIISVCYFTGEGPTNVVQSSCVAAPTLSHIIKQQTQTQTQTQTYLFRQDCRKSKVHYLSRLRSCEEGREQD